MLRHSWARARAPFLGGGRSALSSSTVLTGSSNPKGKKVSQLPSRDEQIERLSSGETFDVLVVGGGATGAGAALDAQMRGLNTVMIERGDFSSETSSRSTKLIWAGIRYIATATAQLLQVKNLARPVGALKDFWSEFKMVLGAHKERRILLENNPHLTNWVPIAVPISSWISWPPPFGHPIFSIAPLVLPAVFKLYDSLSGFTCPPSHIMSKSRARRKFPQLDEEVNYVQVFYEGQHNDSRTALSIALSAAEEGATVSNYIEMTDVIFDDTLPKGEKAVGIKCLDKLTGIEHEVRARAIIFAGGPFTDSMRYLEDSSSKPAVAGAAGTHIVLPGYYSPPDIGMLDINTSDGRFLFFLPWQGATLVGTTDRKGDPVSTPRPPEDEIKWILNEVEKYLAEEVRVRRADVLSAWQGWRPLASDPHAEPGAPISRDHIISTNPDSGITFITGGKWTTYREMAEDVIDRVVDLKGLGEVAGVCRTKTKKLWGGEGYTKNTAVKLVQKFGIAEDMAKHLAKTYGILAFEVCYLSKPSGKRWPRFGKRLVEGYPYIESEITYACRNEYVCTVKDMISLRFRLAYINSEAALMVAPRVADLMADAMGWSQEERDVQLDDAIEHLSNFGGPMPKGDEDIALSVATVHDLHSLFKLLDADDNGYIDFEEMVKAAANLGFPFGSEDGARAAFQIMDKAGDGRVNEKDFTDWWQDEGPDNELRQQLALKFNSQVDKLGSDSQSRGVMFG